MILRFHGGARFDDRTLLGENKIEPLKIRGVVCIPAKSDAYEQTEKGTNVLIGDMLGMSDGTPVYSSVAGIYQGILEIDGSRYFIVMSNGEQTERKPFRPEHRALTDIPEKDIAEAAKKYAVINTRNGMPLWKTLEKAIKRCKRVVIDCTESDPLSAVNTRICKEKARSVVGGAKILIHAGRALKCVFAAESSKTAIFDTLSEYAYDSKLFAFAELDEKYPYSDRTLMYALYAKHLKKNETALDHGVLIVNAETAAALYDAMISGMPMTRRYISVCGEGIKNGSNLCVPRGTTIRDVTTECGLEDGYLLIENSRLSGKPAVGTVGDGTNALIAVKPGRKKRTHCIYCGRCADACPVRLMPFEILSGRSKKIADICVGCGACEYVCPSGIPLLGIISTLKQKNKDDASEVKR